MPLTPKQNRFVAEYLVDQNATKAAVRAGYSPKTAAKIGSENLQKPDVRRAIDEALARRAERVEVKQDDVLRELLRIMRCDIGEAFDVKGRLKPLKDIPEDVRRAMAGVKVRQEFEHGEDGTYHSGDLVEVKFWAKDKAVELAMRHLGLLKDKMEHELGKSFEELVRESMKPGGS